MSEGRVVIAGGGAAGFFAAITCAETCPEAEVILLEKGPRFLSKVRISGGGRCNVTHACFDARELSRYYPRGGSALLGPFQAFQPADTVAWFEERGVRLKTEDDGRIFPVTDTSQTVIDCLMRTAIKAGVKPIANRSLETVTRCDRGGFELGLYQGEKVQCDRLMLATGGCRSVGAGQLAVSLGHSLELPVPSLFSFHLADSWLCSLSGIAVPVVEASIVDLGLKARGAVLLTHSGISGPAILQLSSWGARKLHELDYHFTVRINWLPGATARALEGEIERRRTAQAARLIVNTPFPPLAARLWENLVSAAGVARETRWAELSRAARHRLVQQIRQTELKVTGKSLNKEEFVTCGGVRLDEVDFKTMESRVCPGLYLGGELLDIDGLTGGFNFQSAWTTGWLAGKAMGRELI